MNIKRTLHEVVLSESPITVWVGGNARFCSTVGHLNSFMTFLTCRELTTWWIVYKWIINFISNKAPMWHEQNCDESKHKTQVGCRRKYGGSTRRPVEQTISVPIPYLCNLANKTSQPAISIKQNRFDPTHAVARTLGKIPMDFPRGVTRATGGARAAGGRNVKEKSCEFLSRRHKFYS